MSPLHAAMLPPSAPHPADELDDVLGAPVWVQAGGERLAVRGVWMCELPAFLRLHERQPDAELQARALFDPEAAQAVQAHAAALLDLLAQSCGRSAQWLAALDEAELQGVFEAMKAANRALFGERRAAPHASAPGEPAASWARAVALLVECGHALDAVAHYTVGQVERLLAAHAALSADRRLDELCLARAAQADAEGFKRAVAEIKRSRRALGSSPAQG